MSRPLSADVRRRALDHAKDMVLAEGLAAVTFEALARRSGVAKTTLYRHWDDRSTLLRDVFGELVVPVSTPDTGSLRGDLAHLLAGLPDASTEQTARRTFFLLMQEADVDPTVRAVKDAMVEHRSAPIRAIIAAAVERGELPAAVDIDLSIDVVFGPLVARRLIRQLPLDDAVAARLLDAVEAALTRC